VRTGRVQLLVADIAMPEIDGYELIQRIRQLDIGVPAVAVSAYARAEDRGRALALGYDDYCAKPVEPSEFLSRIRQIMTVA
jgi:CheY-like chemotaxis protein